MTKIYTLYLYLLLSFILASPLGAQVDLQNIKFTGKVHADGKGIAGVSVTDGVNIVQTDSKGKYSLLSNATAEYIYITIPAGYQIPIVDKVPCFYQKVSNLPSKLQKKDFELEKLDISDDKHIIITWADPQVYYQDELPEVQRAADDVKQLIQQRYKDVPVYGILAGDIIANIWEEATMYPPMIDIINSIDIPFFYAVGNHDMDITSRSNYKSKETYKKYFGPNYYSFNRGKIHYVVLDDVFFTARNGQSIGYLDEMQLQWLEQDLSTVEEGSTVVVTLHIPTYSPEARLGEYGKEEMHRVLQNRVGLYKLLEPYNVHIFSGHEHYTENYQIKKYIFEHVHTSLCGLFWMAPWSWDGSPQGYTVYEMDGDEVRWYSKSIGEDIDFQFNAYPVGSSKQKEDAIIANVWNYDSAWKVYWYENDVLMGEMQQFRGVDPSIYNYVVANEHNFKHKYIGAARTDHLFFAIPQSETSKIRVEVVDRFGTVYRQMVN